MMTMRKKKMEVKTNSHYTHITVQIIAKLACMLEDACITTICSVM